MKLEEQLAELARAGYSLDEGISVDDLLYSFDRKQFEERPFDLLLFMLGAEVEREPWGRTFCSRVWSFDIECIHGTGNYVRIVKRLCAIAGQPDRLTDVSDHVDLDTGDAWLQYQLDGKQCRWNIEVNGNWADMMTICYVMDDIQQNGCRFYSKENGQSMILFYLDDATANELNKLADNALQPVIPD